MKVVAVGSNIEPAKHVPSGLRHLNTMAPIVAASRFFVTPAIDRPDQPDYWNGCVAVTWPGTPDDLQAACRDIEAAEGRVRVADRWAARELDLDVIVWGPQVDASVASRDFLQQGLRDLSHPDGRQHDGLMVAPWGYG